MREGRGGTLPRPGVDLDGAGIRELDAIRDGVDRGDDAGDRVLEAERYDGPFGEDCIWKEESIRGVVRSITVVLELAEVTRSFGCML